MTDRDALIREIAKKRVAHRLPGMDDLPVRRDLTFPSASGSHLSMDVYYPSPGATKTAPVVLAPLAYPDPGGGVRSYGPLTSWAQLVAASGMATVLYGNEKPDEDVQAVLQYLRAEGGTLGLDTQRLGLFAASGNVTVALSTLMRESDIRCAALLYGCTMDLDGSTAIADMSLQAGFVNACAGKSIDDLPSEVPMLLVRAGRDHFPGLNEALDRVIAGALRRNLPFTIINHATANHGFDLEDTDISVVEQVLGFLKRHLVMPSSALAA